ncbi:MAG: hypothetical protein KKD18_00305, partial [Nanoarchaeota archaeon]|nr:hypothetical protein [Nanoarchaeota archaeon]
DGTYNPDPSSPTDKHQFFQDRIITLSIYTADWSQCQTVQKTVHISEPTMQFLDASTTLNHAASDLSLDGDLAWVSHGWAELSVVDVSNPSDLQEVSRVEFPMSTSLSVTNGLLFLSQGGYGLDIYHATLPAPEFITNYNTYSSDGQSVQDIVAMGNIVFVSAYTAGLKVLDVSEPSSPQLIGVLTLPDGARSRYLEVKNGIAFLTDNQYRVHLIDVSMFDIWNPEPATPILRSTVSSSYLYGTLAISENGLFAMGTFEGVKLFNVQNPSNPILLSTIPYDGTQYPAAALIFSDNRLYQGFGRAAGYSMRIKKADVTNPSEPYVMETLLIGADQMNGAIASPVLCNGAICWMSGYADVMTSSI